MKKNIEIEVCRKGEDVRVAKRKSFYFEYYWQYKQACDILEDGGWEIVVITFNNYTADKLRKAGLI